MHRKSLFSSMEKENSFEMNCIIFWNNLLSACENGRTETVVILRCCRCVILFQFNSFWNRDAQICSVKFSELFSFLLIWTIQCMPSKEYDLLCVFKLLSNKFENEKPDDGVTIWFSVLLFVSVLKSIRIIRVGSLKPLLGLFEIK